MEKCCILSNRKRMQCSDTLCCIGLGFWNVMPLVSQHEQVSKDCTCLVAASSAAARLPNKSAEMRSISGTHTLLGRPRLRLFSIDDDYALTLCSFFVILVMFEACRSLWLRSFSSRTVQILNYSMTLLLPHSFAVFNFSPSLREVAVIVKRGWVLDSLRVFVK